MDAFLLLTPLLLLGVLALLGFTGCIPTTGPIPGALVEHVHTTVKAAKAGDSAITTDPFNVTGYAFLIATLQWATPSNQTPALTMNTGIPFAPLDGGGPFAWNGMQVQTFWLFNGDIDPDEQLRVTATLPGASTVESNLCVTAYQGVNQFQLPDPPLYSPQTSDLSYVGTNPQTPAINAGAQDMIYAVGFAADSDGSFPGVNNLTAGPGFTGRGGQEVIKNPLVEDIQGTGNPLSAEVTNTTQAPNPKGFIFAMGIRTLQYPPES